ncbi:hypothetical protein SAMN05216349_12424 [Oribacterium sp. KHPX15]|nr:hypothetical protein SAMN05216349_12424 [Oribacterium sp. KHPX15]
MQLPIYCVIIISETQYKVIQNQLMHCDQSNGSARVKKDPPNIFSPSPTEKMLRILSCSELFISTQYHPGRFSSARTVPGGMLYGFNTEPEFKKQFFHTLSRRSIKHLSQSGIFSHSLSCFLIHRIFYLCGCLTTCNISRPALRTNGGFYGNRSLQNLTA